MLNPLLVPPFKPASIQALIINTSPVCTSPSPSHIFPSKYLSQRMSTCLNNPSRGAPVVPLQNSYIDMYLWVPICLNIFNSHFQPLSPVQSQYSLYSTSRPSFKFAVTICLIFSQMPFGSSILDEIFILLNCFQPPCCQSKANWPLPFLLRYLLELFPDEIFILWNCLHPLGCRPKREFHWHSSFTFVYPPYPSLQQS